MTSQSIYASSTRLAAWNARLAAAATIVVSFWVVGHSLSQSRTLFEQSALDANRVENRFAAQQSVTTTSSALGFFLLGAMGVVCWGTSSSERISWRHPLIWFCAAYIGWCVASMLWTTDGAQTVRKLGILALMLIGAFGAASRFDLDDLLAIVMLALAGLIGVGFLAELGLGMFRPWRSDYRFAGTCHPNDQAVQCALLALAAAGAAWMKRDRPWLRRLLVAAGLIGLALSKSRTTLLALVIAAALAAVLSARGLQRWLVLSVGVAALSLAGIAANFVSVTDLDQTFDVASMGRRENVSSLTGRLPLWNELWKSAEKRPLAGHGYGGFWGEKNVLKYSAIFAWHIPHAHNGYLDLMLAVGVIGAALYVAWVVATGVVAGARFETWRDSGDLFVVCLLAFSLIHAVTESKFPGAGIGAFFVMMAMAAVAIRAPAFALNSRLATQVPEPLHWNKVNWQSHVVK
jgi:exopolysaccharide production protein ExoQ